MSTMVQHRKPASPLPGGLDRRMDHVAARIARIDKRPVLAEAR
jgi:hypothetical protein